MNLKKLQSDPAAFRDALLIDTDAGPKPLKDCIDPWQRADFEALDAGWQRAVKGQRQVAKYQRGWLERPRGHSKSADLAVMATWALFASRRRLSGIAAAGDQDQARLLRDAMGKLVHCNPWLSKFIEVQAYRALNIHTQSTLEIISSDAPTSYGLTPDFCICDEVVHWKKRDLWDALISSAAKRATCMYVVITNAGLRDDWQWQTREAVRQDEGWYFSRLESPSASWINAELLAEQERLLPGVAFRRLWLNEWTSGGGDALTEEIIQAAIDPRLRPLTLGDEVPGMTYVAGVDIGVTRDHSALCVLGVKRSYQGHGEIVLAALRVWKPTKGNRVDLSAVEAEIIGLFNAFEFRTLHYDPYELRSFASRLQAGGMGSMEKMYSRLSLIEVPPTGQNLQKLASTLLEAFNDRRVRLFNDPDLIRDIRRLRVEERSYGFRLTSPRDQYGHGDTATAFSLALMGAMELAAKKQARAGVISDYGRGCSPDSIVNRGGRPVVGVITGGGRFRIDERSLIPGYDGPSRLDRMQEQLEDIAYRNLELAEEAKQPRGRSDPENIRVYEHRDIFRPRNT